MKKKLVLIVEDDLASLDFETVSLESAGLVVDGAGSADVAREKIVRRRPDLILMDIQLPGMDGLEFTKQLKADPRTAGIRVVALTSHNMPIYERAARAAGCLGFIVKPSSPSVLIAEVRAFLDGATT
jgi:two-component system cell cycle response regulator DivK